jgi:outer membrane protein OmpA-like peptidoglycan-associated protein
MATRMDIRKHMPVLAVDGANVGTVDDITADHIKLTRSGSPDGHHHQVPIGWVARVDQAVHLNRSAADVLALGSGVEAGGAHILPPIANPAVEGAAKRSNYYLPWILLALALLVILLLLTRSCARHEEQAGPATPAGQTAPLAVEAVTLPGGTKVNVSPNTLNYELQRYLASDEPTPRAFTFDKLNFDTAKSDIRPDDRTTIDTLSQILNAYPNARAQVVGYADARGAAPTNVDLGRARANSVLAALTDKGVAKDRLTAMSGGASNPVASNATPQGQFENRRTELVVTAK